MILGPADADHYRVKVGRYGDRWYTDPLPSCPIAPAVEDAAWPSISTCKKASGSDWSFVAMKRIAHAQGTELHRMADQPPARRYDTCKSINAHGLNVAAGRGTILHWWGEDMLHGREPRTVDQYLLGAHKLDQESLELALLYLPAFRQWFETYQPELIATEYVTVHRTLNGHGYGGTPDGLMRIRGKVYAYDFKSRSPDGDHAAYPEDGAQIAAGVRADYMIVEGADGAERQRIPDVEAGLVISLKPEGVRVYPVDIDAAFRHWEAMHAWWCARLTEREPIGRAWQPQKTPELTPAHMTRADAVALLGHVHPEGGPAGDHEFAPLVELHGTLEDGIRKWFHNIITDSARAGVDFRAHGARTMRRYELYRGLLTLAAAGDSNDEVLRALVAHVLGNDAPLCPDITVGHAVGSMGATDATRFAETVSEYLAGGLTATVQLDGHLHLDRGAQAKAKAHATVQ